MGGREGTALLKDKQGNQIPAGKVTRAREFLPQGEKRKKKKFNGGKGPAGHSFSASTGGAGWGLVVFPIQRYREQN